MNEAKLASAKCYLAWASNDASYKDWQYFHKLDLWRDLLPGDLSSQASQLCSGDSALTHIRASDILPEKQNAATRCFKRNKIISAFESRSIPGPCIGRFYPKGILSSALSSDTIYPEDMTPFRITAMNDEQIEVDFTHPLTGYDLSVGITIEEMLPVKEQRGGHCNDIIYDIAMYGSGMQCQFNPMSISYLLPDSFSRLKETDDKMFYSVPRLVHHIDMQARSIISSLYQEHICAGMKILDLMSSWESHLHEGSGNIELSGLGMNEEELKANHALQSYVVRDLNTNPTIPYTEKSFDLVICTVSIEYLTNPLQVFNEVTRILKPGGKFIITFSDRWFPEKVIRIWTELHPYERMGLVLEYFRTAGQFTNLKTESWHGWLRPSNDKYFSQKLLSDPVFAVMGTRQ